MNIFLSKYQNKIDKKGRVSIPPAFRSVWDAFETIVMGESIQLQFDNEGRVIIPAHLMQQVGITEQAVFVGKGLVFEVWDPVAFDAHLKTAKAVAQSNRFILKNQENSGVGA